MAKKDWKKTTKSTWGMERDIYSPETLEIWKSSRTGKWNVTLVPTTGEDVHLKTGFKTRVNALKFAKNYMKLGKVI